MALLTMKLRNIIPYVEALLVYGVLLLAILINIDAATLQDQRDAELFIPQLKEYQIEVIQKKELKSQNGQSNQYDFKYHSVSYLQDPAVKYLLYHLTVFAGVVFSVYYGTKGMIFALLGFFIALFFMYYPMVTNFPHESWVRSIFSIILFSFVGSARELTRRSIKELQSTNYVLHQQNKELIVNLVSLDRSHKKYLADVYCRVDSHKYLFHELRRMLQNITDEEEIFKKVFSALFRYNFVEGGVVYKKEENAYRTLLRYGVSNASAFPEKLEKGQYPAWLKVLQKAGRVITPKIENKQFIIAIPISDNPWEKGQNFIVLIERIRYTMQTPDTQYSLKVISLLLQYIMEKRLTLLSDNIAKYSIARETIIYQPSIAKELLLLRLKMFATTEVSYKLTFLECTEPDVASAGEQRGCAACDAQLMESCNNLTKLGKFIDEHFRETDEKFLIGNRLFLLFPFADDFQSILKKAHLCSWLKELKEISDEDAHHIMVKGDFNHVAGS